MTPRKDFAISDFDRWRALAEQDPEAFERARHRVIQAAIARAPRRHHRRLQGLQWRVEQERRRASNPMAACVALSYMMWDSVAGRHGLLEALTCFSDGRRPPRESAKVLPLTRGAPQ